VQLTARTTGPTNFIKIFPFPGVEGGAAGWPRPVGQCVGCPILGANSGTFALFPKEPAAAFRQREGREEHHRMGSCISGVSAIHGHKKALETVGFQGGVA
jgi:hypothetical protein